MCVLTIAVLLVACGDDTVASASGDGSTGTSGSGPEGSGGGSTLGTTAASGGSSGSAVTSGADGGSESTTGATEHCQLEVVESVQLSAERFGTLTLAEGDAALVLLGSWGWTLAGSVESPVVERFVEPAAPMLAGRFGPGGGWAYAELDAGTVRVLPLGDPGTSIETSIGPAQASVVGDLDEDGVDDLIVVDADTHHLWQADGLGGFSLAAASDTAYPGAISGFAPATAWAPAAVLVGQPDSGVLGLELVGDALEKVYAVEIGFVWSMGGVTPPAGAGRSLLVAREGGVLIDPLVGEVGFLDGQAGVWTRRAVELGESLSAPPRALDLDADGVLDVVAATSTLRGACSTDDALVPCLEAPQSGTPESLAVHEDGLVFVATEDAGLWVHRLGACR